MHAHVHVCVFARTDLCRSGLCFPDSRVGCSKLSFGSCKALFVLIQQCFLLFDHFCLELCLRLQRLVLRLDPLLTYTFTHITSCIIFMHDL